MPENPTPPSAPGNQPPNPPAPGPGNPPGNPPANPPATPPAPTKPINEMTFEELAAANPHAKGMLRDLQDERSKRQELEKSEAARREKEMADQGQFKTLAETKQKEADDFRVKYETEAKRNAFFAAATAAKVTDLDAAWKLADHGKITLDANGAVAGAKEAIEELVKAKPYLVGNANPPKVGDPSAPPADPNAGDKRIYKRSELRDTAFFEKNKADIMLAYKENRIIDG